MREDEIISLLALDNAGLTVDKDLFGWEAIIRLPKDFNRPQQQSNTVSLAFTGHGESRQLAVAEVWQKYQQFASTEAGLQTICDNHGQVMFRV